MCDEYYLPKEQIPATEAIRRSAETLIRDNLQAQRTSSKGRMVLHDNA